MSNRVSERLSLGARIVHHAMAPLPGLRLERTE
jgi:hypothetical protein